MHNAIPHSESPRIIQRARNTTWGFLTLLLLLCTGEIAVTGTETACLAKKSLVERLEFASESHAEKILGRPDDWALQLSAFEKSPRVRTLEPVSTRMFLDHSGEAALGSTAEETAWWGSLSEVLSEAVEGLNLRMSHVLMLKTSGLEELNAAYSRNKAMVHWWMAGSSKRCGSRSRTKQANSAGSSMRKGATGWSTTPTASRAWNTYPRTT